MPYVKTRLLLLLLLIILSLLIFICFKVCCKTSKKLSLQSTAENWQCRRIGDARTDSGRMFQMDTVAAGKARSTMVARELGKRAELTALSCISMRNECHHRSAVAASVDLHSKRLKDSKCCAVIIAPANAVCQLFECYPAQYWTQYWTLIMTRPIFFVVDADHLLLSWLSSSPSNSARPSSGQTVCDATHWRAVPRNWKRECVPLSYPEIHAFIRASSSRLFFLAQWLLMSRFKHAVGSCQSQALEVTQDHEQIRTGRLHMSSQSSEKALECLVCAWRDVCDERW